MKRIYVMSVLIIALGGTLWTPLFAENPYLGIEQVLHIDTESGEMASAPLYLTAEWERFGDRGELFVSAEVELPAGDPAQEELRAEIDEAYGTLYTDFGDISAGRQRIAWGVLDALSVLDVVHAADLRSYTAPWRENDRSATDGLRWKYYGRSWCAEAVWEPVTGLNKWPEQFDPTALYPEGVPVEELSPVPSWEKSGFSGRMCWYLNAADVGVQLGKTTSRTPLSLLEGEVPADFTIREVQKSYYHAGLWSTVPLKAWILRMEGAYKRRFPSLSEDGRKVMREDRLLAAGGLEWNGPGGMRLLIEGEGNLDVSAEDMGESLEQHYMIGVSWTLLRERLEIEAGGLYTSEIEGIGGELRAEYSLSDRMFLKGGLSYLESNDEVFKELAGTALWCALQWSM